MEDVESWLAVFGGMSGGALAVLVILGAFALAGTANAYRLADLDSYLRLGTRGRDPDFARAD